MNELHMGIAWPAALATAWILGEVLLKHASIPRISSYALVGCVFAAPQLGWLQVDDASVLPLVANFAFALLLFECGHRFNVGWLRANPWIAATGACEALATFGVVFAIAIAFSVPVLQSALIASLAMATSPATIMRVVDEQRSAGQVTERVVHLATMNCVLATVAFKLLLGIWVLQTSGDAWRAAFASTVVLAASALLGAFLGVVMPWLLRMRARQDDDATVVLALAVLVLVSVVHVLGLSPILAALTFGMVARHRRGALAQAQRGFGTLGQLLALLLFTYVAATIDLGQAIAGLALGTALVLARLVTKVLAITALARPSGISLRKGVLTGLAMAPLSAFVILQLEQARRSGVVIADEFAALAAAALILELIGPALARFALRWADETPVRAWRGADAPAVR